MSPEAIQTAFSLDENGFSLPPVAEQPAKKTRRKEPLLSLSLLSPQEFVDQYSAALLGRASLKELPEGRVLIANLRATQPIVLLDPATRQTTQADNTKALGVEKFAAVVVLSHDLSQAKPEEITKALSAFTSRLKHSSTKGGSVLIVAEPYQDLDKKAKKQRTNLLGQILPDASAQIVRPRDIRDFNFWEAKNQKQINWQDLTRTQPYRATQALAKFRQAMKSQSLVILNETELHTRLRHTSKPYWTLKLTATGVGAIVTDGQSIYRIDKNGQMENIGSLSGEPEEAPEPTEQEPIAWDPFGHYDFTTGTTLPIGTKYHDYCGCHFRVEMVNRTTGDSQTNESKTETFKAGVAFWRCADHQPKY